MLIDNALSRTPKRLIERMLEWEKEKKGEKIKIDPGMRAEDFERALKAINNHPNSDERERLLMMLYDGTNEQPLLKSKVLEAITQNNNAQAAEQKQIPQAAPAASLDREDERQILAAAALLQSHRALDNSQYKGKEVSNQQNETLDLIGQLKKHLDTDKKALEKIEAAGLSPQNIGAKNVGKAGVGPLKGFEVIARNKDSVTLLKGKSLYVYELQRLNLQAPPSGLQIGDKVDLTWSRDKDKASMKINEPQKERSFVRKIEAPAK